MKSQYQKDDRRNEDDRMVRIETKLDLVSEKVEVIIRIEERQSSSQAWLERMQYQLDAIDQRNRDEIGTLHGAVNAVRVEEKALSTHFSIKSGERTIWGIVSGSLALYVAAKEFFVEFFSRG